MGTQLIISPVTTASGKGVGAIGAIGAIGGLEILFCMIHEHCRMEIEAPPSES